MSVSFDTEKWSTKTRRMRTPSKLKWRFPKLLLFGVIWFVIMILCDHSPAVSNCILAQCLRDPDYLRNPDYFRALYELTYIILVSFVGTSILWIMGGIIIYKIKRNLH